MAVSPPTGEAMLVSIVVLSQLIQASPSAQSQWVPPTGNLGYPTASGTIPEDVLERLRASYRHGNRGAYLPPQFPNSPYFSPSSASYIGGAGAGGVNVQNYPGAMANTHLYQNDPSGQLAPASIPTTTNSKFISGDYCFEPLLTCDTTNTLLYCIQGRCTCPTKWTLAPGNLPLNTVWHPEIRKCVSTPGSGCHLVTSSANTRFPPPPSSASPQSDTAPHTSIDPYHPSPPSSESSTSSTTKVIAATLIQGLIGGSSGMGFVSCQPGVQCVRQSGYQETGICAGVTNKSNYFILLTLVSILTWHHIRI